MPQNYPSHRSSGFTLVEMAFVACVLGILASVAISSTRKADQQNEERGAERRLLFLLQEARNTGLELASAGGTAQIDVVNNCPADVNALSTVPSGQATVVIDLSTSGCIISPCDRVTYLASVRRDSGTNVPPTFTVGCNVVEFTSGEGTKSNAGEYVRGLRFDASRMIVRAGSVPNRFVIVYDSRGFVKNLPAGSAGIKLGTMNMVNNKQSGFVILGSGHACRDNSPTTMTSFTCAHQ